MKSKKEKMKIAFIAWDRHDPLDLSWLMELFHLVFDGKKLPYIVDIDAKQDMYIAGVSSKAVGKRKAQKIWEDYFASLSDEDDPYGNVLEI